MATKKNTILSKQEIFIKLATDKKPFVRTALAQNPEIDKEIQDIFVNLDQFYTYITLFS